MRQNWTTFLSDVLPSNWQWPDADSFLIADHSGTIEWRCTGATQDDSTLNAIYSAQSLELTVDLTAYRDARAVQIQFALTNHGDEPCRIHRLQLIDLKPSSTQGPILFRTIDGGTNVKHYPPDIFNIHDYLCDGTSGIWREHGWGGRSSENTLPLLGVEMNGAAVIGGLEWSGLWWSSANGNDNGDSTVNARLLFHIPVDGLTIQPGEKLTLPSAHLVFSDQGLADAGNNCRRHIAENIQPRLAGKRIDNPPIVYNHWFGLGPNINEAVLMQQATTAAQIGAEYFILDAGWYGDCDGDDFESGVGNWDIIDTAKFPNGIKPLARQVRELGMKFGIWFEPERAHVKSDWYRKHPDWFLKRGDEHENSHVHIDLTNSEARRNVVRVLSTAITELGAEWIKWDYNINPKPFWQHNDPTGRLMFDYLDGLYAVQSELLKRHPEVVFECCASGGRRIDLGQIRRTHIALLSDSASSSLVCRFMQTGANAFLPSSYLGVGLPFGSKDTTPNNNEGPLRDFTLLSRLCGAPTIFGDIASLNETHLGVLTENLHRFKNWRHLTKGDFFELLPQPKHLTDHAAVQFLDTASGEAVILVFSGPHEQRLQSKIHPRALTPDTDYAIQHLGGTECKLVEGSGAELMQTGWHITLEPKQATAFKLTPLSR